MSSGRFLGTIRCQFALCGIALLVLSVVQKSNFDVRYAYPQRDAAPKILPYMWHDIGPWNLNHMWSHAFAPPKRSLLISAGSAGNWLLRCTRVILRSDLTSAWMRLELSVSYVVVYLWDGLFVGTGECERLLELTMADYEEGWTGWTRGSARQVDRIFVNADKRVALLYLDQCWHSRHCDSRKSICKWWHEMFRWLH